MADDANAAAKQQFENYKRIQEGMAEKLRLYRLRQQQQKDIQRPGLVSGYQPSPQDYAAALARNS